MTDPKLRKRAKQITKRLGELRALAQNPMMDEVKDFDGRTIHDDIRDLEAELKEIGEKIEPR